MPRKWPGPDQLLLGLIGIASVLVGLLDTFGLLGSIATTRRLPELDLVIGGLILTQLLLSERRHLRERTKADQLRVRERDKLQKRLVSLERLVEVSTVDQLPIILESVEPAILKIFRDYLGGVFSTPAQLIKTRTFQLENLESYRAYHRRTLEVNPGRVFYATSLPYQKWFWRSDDPLEPAMEKFIRHDRGRIQRIFFLGEDALDSPEVRGVLDAQHRVGVEVFTISAAIVPLEKQRFFLVEATGSFAWESQRGPDDRVSKLTVTANLQAVRTYIALFKELLDSGAVRYRSGHALSQQMGMARSERPVNVSKEPDAFLHFEYSGWQNAVDRYHQDWGVLTSQAVPHLLAAVEARSGKSLLDIACGPGYLAAQATELGMSAIGLDFSEHMIQKAQAIYPASQFRLGNAEALPFEDDEFDSVAMNFGMLHLGKPEAAIRQAFRVLRKGGRYAFTVWARPEEAVAFAVVLKAVEEYGEPVAVPHGPDFFYYSRPDECRTALINAGFSSPNVMVLDLRWRLPNAHEMFLAFYEGTARTGALLRRQADAARESILAAIVQSATAFETTRGDIELPMPALLAWGVKA